jgi:actin-related protein 6
MCYRQLHVLDETYVMNQVKEDVCFVSTDFRGDMEIAKKRFPENNIVQEYVLPDYSSIKRGFIRPVDKMGTKAINGEQV